jgi:hypothetical protein
LADAYGNTIDSVEYFDADPWPTSADGGGTYLDLVNTALDNNIASSWVAKMIIPNYTIIFTFVLFTIYLIQFFKHNHSIRKGSYRS